MIPGAAAEPRLPIAPPATTEPRERSLAHHLPALDGVRGVAIALVLLHNFNLDGPVGGAAGRAFNAMFEVGWIGVQLFFVLSGFLITGILLDTRGAPNAFGAFYARRVLRIFPLYYAALAARFLVLPHLLTLPPALAAEQREQVWYWTYLANWTAPFGHGVTGFGHFWSLAVEEQFYLVWPLVVLPLGARGVRRACAALLLVALAARVAMLAAGMDAEAVYQLTITRVDALAMGGYLAARLRDGTAVGRADVRRQVFASSLACAALVLATRGLPRTSAIVDTIGFSVLAWWFAAIVGSAALADATSTGGRLVRALRGAPLRTLGRYSYGMYVFHLPLHLLLVRAASGLLAAPDAAGRLLRAAAYVPVASGLTLALAWISWRVIEQPFLRLKARFVASDARPATI